MIIIYILIAIVLLLVLIAFIPLGLIFEYKNHLKVYVKVFGIKFTVYDKSQKTHSFSNAESTVENKKDSHPETNISLKKLLVFFQVSKEMVKTILTYVRIKKLYFNLKVGGVDASDVAIRYGKACGVIYPLFEYLLVCNSSGDVSVLVSPNFGKEKDTLYFELELHSKLFYLLFNMIVYSKKFRNLLKNEGE